ncbi:7-cyano-7-deazaguanine trna-ribosyltransferase [Lasius niger]|uniref:7-cyano-7-deazaguanine trna-ribosyltransferase n=1 Tax=Lasius niger TaxID=67767 RepID=A0A0J7KUI1_LASNI|nr:7-cyano-7-deazaguanine trna-ribosyltransferase [Lasius niger]
MDNQQAPQIREQEWQQITNKKRTRSSPEILKSNKKQTQIKDYWLNKPVSTSNTYEKLSDEEDQESNADNIKNKYETKSPPIFLDGVENIAPLKQALDGVARINT